MLVHRLLRKQSRVYLDYGAATPVRSAVRSAMEPYFSRVFANAGAIHQEGVQAHQAVEKARGDIATILGIRSDGVTFTGSGTEANNLALLGRVAYLRSVGKEYADIQIITTEIEHPSLLEACAQLERKGVVISYAPVTDTGVIDVNALEKLLCARTALLTFAYANSEVGVVQPVGKIARTVRKFAEAHGLDVVIHLDAAQAPLWLPCDMPHLDVDMMSLDAGKCEGPKGIGVLARRHKVKLAPIQYGGGQEAGLRPGTENTPLIVGCAKALELAQLEYEERARKARLASTDLLTALSELSLAKLNGPEIGENRLANNINISLPGLDAEYLVISLDEAGIAAATRSACGSLSTTGSHVVRTISGSNGRAVSTIRFTHSGVLKSADIQKIIAVLQHRIEQNVAITT